MYVYVYTIRVCTRYIGEEKRRRETGRIETKGVSENM